MKFFDEMKPLYMETDASRVGLGAAILQTREGTSCARDEVPDNNILRLIAFMSRNLSAVERRYSDIEREVLAILHGLETWHHYCFARGISIITYHKLLVEIFKKKAWLHCHRIQHILLMIHQYRVSELYKPGPDLLIADWLSRQNHKKKKQYDVILGMKININAIDTATDIPKCMAIQEIQQAEIKDEYLQQIGEHSIRGWSESRNEALQEIRLYWTFRDDW